MSVAVQLRRYDVPSCPVAPRQGTDAQSMAEAAALDDWALNIEQSYVMFCAARAAKSLREAEEARGLEMLRSRTHEPRRRRPT
ncbi:hypothetical protein J7E62_31505 [Variovorax paradoxus]|nr:hypothetical protein [Variovorax paradoxus]